MNLATPDRAEAELSTAMQDSLAVSSGARRRLTLAGIPPLRPLVDSQPLHVPPPDADSLDSSYCSVDRRHELVSALRVHGKVQTDPPQVNAANMGRNEADKRRSTYAGPSASKRRWGIKPPEWQSTQLIEALLADLIALNQFESEQERKVR